MIFFCPVIRIARSSLMNNKKTLLSKHVSIIKVPRNYSSFFTFLELNNMKQALDSLIPFLSSFLLSFMKFPTWIASHGEVIQ